MTYKPGDIGGYLLSSEAARVRKCLDGISEEMKGSEVTPASRAGSRALALAEDLGLELARQGRLEFGENDGHLFCLVGRNATWEEAEALAKGLRKGVCKHLASLRFDEFSDHVKKSPRTTRR